METKKQNKFLAFFVALLPYWIYLGAQLVAGIIIGIIINVSSMMNGEVAALSSTDTIIAGIVSNIAAFIAVIIEMKITHTDFKDISPEKSDLFTYIMTIVFSFGMFFVLQALTKLFLKIIGVTEADNLQNMLTDAPFYLSVLLALSAPFIEELVFRGMLVHELEKRNFSIPFTVISVSVLFLLLHSVNMMFYAFLFSLVLLLIRYKLKNLILCFTFHFICNGMSCLTLIIPDKYSDKKYLYIAAIIGLFVAAASFYALLRHKSKSNKIVFS